MGKHPMIVLNGFFKSNNAMLPEQVTNDVIKLSEDPHLPMPLRKKLAFISRDGNRPFGFKCYIQFGDPIENEELTDQIVFLKPEFSYLADGDVVRINFNKKSLRVLFRKASHHNSFLLTERCNHYCLMCSQPPKNIDDSWIGDEILEVIPLVSTETQDLGFTGGEPTLLGSKFIEILRACKNYLPKTAIHILSNGRSFKDESFAIEYAAIEHPDMMVGIPVYSDVSHIHDYVVQADNAFDETIRGILNLKRHGQKVEIRVVIHKQTFERLPQLAEFIARNLIFVDHVALMGLEIMGFTKANLADLWIDPIEYQEKLYQAATTLEAYGMNVSIYNHQLCVLDSRLWKFSRKSISDWKNDYLPRCEGCSQKDNCGGFFTSQLIKHSEYITPFIQIS